MRRMIAWMIVAGSCVSILFSRPAAGADQPAKRPTSQPASETEAARARWENRILFIGDESSNEWSLGVPWKEVDTQRQFRLNELWTYDRDAKRWMKMGTTVLRATMLTSAQKKPNPQNPDDDDPNQKLVDLPIDKDQMGLFYARWSVDGVKGSTYFRIGPGLREKTDPILHQKPPDGKIIAIVPIDISHAVAAFIPDPRLECELEK
jgi:hypothetical protein